MSILKSISDFLFGREHFHMEAVEYVKQGVAKIAINDFKGAMHDFTRAIGQEPEYAEAYYNRGLVHDYFGDSAAATEDLLVAKSLFEQQGVTSHHADINAKLRELGVEGHHTPGDRRRTS